MGIVAAYAASRWLEVGFMGTKATWVSYPLGSWLRLDRLNVSRVIVRCLMKLRFAVGRKGWVELFGRSEVDGVEEYWGLGR